MYKLQSPVLYVSLRNIQRSLFSLASTESTDSDFNLFSLKLIEFHKFFAPKLSLLSILKCIGPLICRY